MSATPTYSYQQHSNPYIVSSGSSASTVTISPNGINTVSGSSVSIDLPPIENTITLGNTRITEEQLKDILVLLEVVNRLDKSNPVQQQFMAVKCRNKLKEENK